MSRRFPEVKFKIKDERTLVGEYAGKEIDQYIDNAYNDYKANPDSLAPILHRYVESAIEGYKSSEKIRSENIVPVIKSVDYLSDWKKLADATGAKHDFDGVYEPYNDQLVVVYAQDSKAGINYFPAGDLQKAGIVRDSLRSIAVRNLSRLLPDIQVKTIEDGVFMITAGGNYEASLLLMDYVWTKQNLAVNGDFIVGVPTRDLLLVTGSNDKAGIAKLKEVVQKMFGTGNYTVSDNLYRREGNRFVKFGG
jgi:uncharacterized protein YtpQ (UPF0354 family)